MNEKDYVSKRLSSSRDDRQCEDKKWDDAILRGSIGTHKANEVIKMIDDYKSRR